MILYSYGNVIDEQLENAEKELGIAFPTSYRKFLKKTNGGEIEKRDFVNIQIPGTQDSFAVSEFLGIDLNEKSNLLLYNKKYREDLGKDKIIFGKDIFENLFVLNLEDANEYVCYWDVNLKLSVSEETANAYALTDSFDKFIEFLDGLTIKNINEKGDKNMERIDYCALGSIVLLEGGIQKLLVTSRGLVVDRNGKHVFFDYAGVPYPDGLISDQIVYFNHSGIAKVVFEGYRDDDDTVTIDNINKYISEHPELEREEPGE